MELMSRTDNLALPRRLRREYYSAMKSPILNFVDMLPDVIEMKDYALF